MLPFAKTADLAIDLGTSSTRLVARGRGLVAEIPTVVATHTGPRGREVVAIGEDARKMLGRTPAGTEVVRPVRGGVVADFDATEHLLRDLLRRVGSLSLVKPRIVVCVPSATTEVERRAVQDATRAAGGREVLLVPSPVAAALGADLPVQRPLGSMIVEIGGGRTEVAVLSLGGVVISRSIRIGGDAMDEAIASWLRNERGVLVGERTTEGVKLRVGCAMPVQPVLHTRIRGRDIAHGAPKEVDVTSTEAAQALSEPVAQIREIVLATLRETPPELSSDILERGILVSGGGGLLRGLERVLREATGLPVLHAEQPLTCVARGVGRLLDDATLFDRMVAVA